jgi:uncharacterized delta-60 repeat protein
MKNRVLQLIILMGVSTFVSAAPGSLDWGFGINGRTRIDIFQGDEANDITLQPDGKILVAGTSGSLGYEFTLARLHPDGSLDQSFGSLGKVRTAFDPFNGRSQAWCMGLQPDGKIILGGTYSPPGIPARLAAVRYLPDGSLDTSFGVQGKAIYDIGTISFVNDLVVRPDGKIILTGTKSFEGFLAVRLNPDGQFDNTFSGDGIVTYPPVTSDSQSYAIALQPDGKIILGGYAHIGGSSNVDFALMRLMHNGDLDPSFDFDGKVTTPIGPHPDQDMADALIIQSDGKIVATGYSLNTGFALARYNTDGSLDTSFGNSGKILTSIGLGTALISGAVLQADGKIVVSGVARGLQTRGDFVVARYNPNGSLDNSFGNRGISITSFSNADDYARRLVIQPDGRIVVAGFGEGDYLISRFQIHGDRTTDFDGDLRSDLAVFRPYSGVWSISRSRDGTYDRVLGVPGDQLVPADYDGDGRTDLAVFGRSSFEWHILNSSSGTLTVTALGTQNEVPVTGDFDRDGKADIGVFRPSDATWRILKSTMGYSETQFGSSGDLPVSGDYDGDGYANLGVFTPATGTWRIQANGSERIEQFGSGSDRLVPSDYDGDGKIDLAFYRRTDRTWNIRNSSTSATTSVVIGEALDLPSPGDFDGDGRTDIAVYRPSNSSWIIQRTTAGILNASWGQLGDIPVQNASVRFATVRISGRVLTPDGRGVRNANVSLIDEFGIRRVSTTSSFGFYQFDAVNFGEQYILAVSSKRYRFASQIRQFEGDVSSLDFWGLE